MESQKEVSRFKIDRLEQRIAPSGAAEGLKNAMSHVIPNVIDTPAPYKFVIANVRAHNPNV